MYNLTYEELLQRALDRVTATVDKTEGSFIYDAIAPTIVELHQCYLYINELENKVYADTAQGEYLERRTAERGINRKNAVNAIRTITFNADVPIGSRWGKEDLIYTVQYRTKKNQFGAICNQAGSIGNRYTGSMINIDSISGINDAQLGEIVVAGAESETDEQLRERFFNSFNDDAFGGNVQDYKNKVGALEGVGSVKVYPTWNGAGTVKLVLLGNDGSVPNDELIRKVQTQVDPTQNAGEGLGIAPIGHTVTVKPAKSVQVNIALNLTFKSGFNWSNVESSVREVITTYLEELRKEWATVNNVIVRIAHIESRILNIAGIEDISNTTINGETNNLSLTDEEVPVVGDVTNG